MFKRKFAVDVVATEYGYQVIYKKWYYLEWQGTGTFWSNYNHALMDAYERNAQENYK